MLTMLVAIDFSECSLKALRAAQAIASKAVNCEVFVVTVLDPLAPDVAQEPAALRETEEAIERLHRQFEAEEAALLAGALPESVKVHYLSDRGLPAECIVRQAKHVKAEVIVMGTNGRRGIDRLLVGSVAESVVRTAPCSVLTVKVGDPTETK